MWRASMLLVYVCLLLATASSSEGLTSTRDLLDAAGTPSPKEYRYGRRPRSPRPMGPPKSPCPYSQQGAPSNSPTTADSGPSPPSPKDGDPSPNSPYPPYRSDSPYPSDSSPYPQGEAPSSPSSSPYPKGQAPSSPSSSPYPQGEAPSSPSSSPYPQGEAPSSPAAPPTSGGDSCPPEYQGILKQHNEYRAKHKAPPLKWSTRVAAQAEKWASGCVFQHSQGSGYGENLGMGYKTFEDCGKAWYDEHSQYNYGSGGFSGATGHFTQVVWVQTTELGCAMKPCNGRPLYVCNYNPPGNYMGKFQENVLAP